MVPAMVASVRPWVKQIVPLRPAVHSNFRDCLIMRQTAVLRLDLADPEPFAVKIVPCKYSSKSERGILYPPDPMLIDITDNLAFRIFLSPSLARYKAYNVLFVYVSRNFIEKIMEILLPPAQVLAADQHRA